MAICTAMLAMAMGLPLWAADAQTSKLVAEANQALAAGKPDDALKKYEQAGQKLPDSSEIAFNQGVAYYRKGDRAKAADAFSKALLTRDIGLEARAKFNLGNCAYGDAVAMRNDLGKAIEKLKTAVSYYKDAIAANPNDVDAKVNIETAQLLMKHLIDEQKRKQEEQKKNPQSQPSSQPQSQPESQPEQPQSQPSSQPQQDQQQQDQEKKDKEKQDQQKQADQQKQEKEQKDQQGKQGEQKDQEKKDGKLEQANPSEQKKDEQNAQEQQAKPAEAKEMSQEQAERLLQMIRDRERQRREAQLRFKQLQQVPVDKDW